jgi:hypothetical protein
MHGITAELEDDNACSSQHHELSRGRDALGT